MPSSGTCIEVAAWHHSWRFPFSRYSFNALVHTPVAHQWRRTLIRIEEVPSKKISRNAILSFTTVEKEICLQSDKDWIAVMSANDVLLLKNAYFGEASPVFFIVLLMLRHVQFLQVSQRIRLTEGYQFLAPCCRLRKPTNFLFLSMFPVEASLLFVGLRSNNSS